MRSELDDLEIIRKCFLKNIPGIKFKAFNFNLGIRKVDLLFEIPSEEEVKYSGEAKPRLIFVEVTKISREGSTRQLLTALGQILYIKEYEREFIKFDHAFECWVAFVYRGVDPHPHICKLYRKHKIALVGIDNCNFIDYA
ncbi:MAG: hypothetical protein NDF54_07660 [archaeon GB-1867-035]|nr:hypothetical protein [Candidatus Culexmicrobium profundum]